MYGWNRNSTGIERSALTPKTVDHCDGSELRKLFPGYEDVPGAKVCGTQGEGAERDSAPASPRPRSRLHQGLAVGGDLAATAERAKESPKGMMKIIKASY